eukprot:scaffold19689_cov31-Tisochrysis_lutea.AAC.8
MRAMRSALLGLALLARATSQQVSVLEVDAAGLQHVVSRTKRVVVFMYDGEECERAHLFQPWLHAIAQRLPSLTFARVDISNSTGTPAIAEYFGVELGSGSPKVKAMIRDADPGKRVINYLGPIEFEPFLEWSAAVLDDLPSSMSEPGYEPPVDEERRSREEEKRRARNAMNNLPSGVKEMAETMVKESRLKRVLEEMGKIDEYEAQVSHAFKSIVKENNINTEKDTYATQEANRLARNLVRERLLNYAPPHIREHVDAEVTLGDGASAMSRGPSAGTAPGGKDEL